MIRDYLTDIIKAKENGAYFSALALALTIPDVCGKIEGIGENSREKYIKWFDKWIYKYFEIPQSENPELSKYDDLLIFDGRVCYALRCAFLHSGNANLKENPSLGVKLDRFELCVCESEWQGGEGMGCYLSYGEVKETHRRFNVINLLDAFVMGTEDYIKECGDASKQYGDLKIIKF